MQKYIILLILCSLPMAVRAQVSFSVAFDPQLTWMKSEAGQVDREKLHFGFNGGLVMDVFFAENYAFSSGFSVWQTGGSLRYADSLPLHTGTRTDTLPSGSTVRYRLQYLTVPFSLKLKSNEIGYTRFFAHLGMNTHFNVKATADASSLDLSGVNISEDIHWFQLSWFFGGGLEYSLGGNTALIGGIYYTSGLLDVTRSEVYRTGLSALSLRLGVKF